MAKRTSVTPVAAVKKQIRQLATAAVKRQLREATKSTPTKRQLKSKVAKPKLK